MDRSLIYRVSAPFYDLAMTGVLRKARRDSVNSMELRPGHRLLIPGIGTGLDLPFLPTDLDILGGDLVPSMLAKAELRKRELGFTRLRLVTLDAMALPVPDGSFDGALLHLILAVAPDGNRALGEAARAVKPGGRIAVLDKFLEGESQVLPRWRRAAQLVMGPFTDINRRFEDMIDGLPLRILSDEGVMFGRTFRRILLERR